MRLYTAWFLFVLGCSPQVAPLGDTSAERPTGGLHLDGAASTHSTVEVDLVPLAWVVVEGTGATGPLALAGESGVEWRAALPMLQPGDLVVGVSGAVDDPARAVVLSLHRDPITTPGQGGVSMVWASAGISPWSIEVDTTSDDVVDPYVVLDGVDYEFAVWLGYSPPQTPTEVTDLSLFLELAP